METGRTVALVVLVLTGLYLVLLLEDEAMQESKVRARSRAGADGALLAGFVGVFLIDPRARLLRARAARARSRS